jgi:hypothetical protein
MKLPLVFQNQRKTRRAVVGGRNVIFYRRTPLAGQKYTPPQQVWFQTYSTHEIAMEAARLWRDGGGILKEVNRNIQPHQEERAGA